MVIKAWKTSSRDPPPTANYPSILNNQFKVNWRLPVWGFFQPFNEIPLGFCFSLRRSLESQAPVSCIYWAVAKMCCILRSGKPLTKGQIKLYWTSLNFKVSQYFPISLSIGELRERWSEPKLVAFVTLNGLCIRPGDCKPLKFSVRYPACSQKWQ